jgi:hypothetical protein
MQNVAPKREGGLALQIDNSQPFGELVKPDNTCNDSDQYNSHKNSPFAFVESN